MHTVPIVWRLLLYVMAVLRSDFAAQTALLSRCIVLPLKWSKVGQVVSTAFGNGGNVVNLPSILIGSVTIVFPAYSSTTLVFTPHCRVVVADSLCLLPDGKFCCVTEVCHRVISYSSCCLNSTAELYSDKWLRCSGTKPTISITNNKSAKSLFWEQKTQK